MNGLKTVLFYLIGLVGLVLMTMLFTSGIEPVEPVPPLMRTATALAAIPSPTPSPAPTKTPDPDCQPTPGGLASGYIPDTPLTTTLAPPDLEGERIIISGTVYASDCETPLPGASIEVWQTDMEGRYDRKRPFTLRGQFKTDEAGRYEFITIRPGSYGIEEVPRPAHIHFLVSLGDEVLATRMFFADDPHLIQSSTSQQALIVTLTEEDKTAEGAMLRGVFDVISPFAPPDPVLSPTPDDQS